MKKITDNMRLDWMERKYKFRVCLFDYPTNTYWAEYRTEHKLEYIGGKGKGLRQAIDAAMRAEKK